MNVLLVSQCSKNALRETRRILDQFGERTGERTWQTPITRAGLETLRHLLRRSARKNTAVACHWIRGRDHTELLWIVGNAAHFNERGSVPTNTTTRDVLRRADEDDWHTGRLIHLLSGLAGLLHDLGKACDAFQSRLQDPADSSRNIYRHEWIGLRLFQAFVGTDPDDEWLERLARAPSDPAAWLKGLVRDGVDADAPSPFRTLPPLARVIGWLVVSHHRLPCPTDRDQLRSSLFEDLPTRITADWNEKPRDAAPGEIARYWTFSRGLPVESAAWARQAMRVARQLQAHTAWDPEAALGDPFLMHLSRLCLMLGDHHYSSLGPGRRHATGDAAHPLHANTLRSTGELNQPLDEHLIGVAGDARAIAHSLPGMERYLPRLARHKGFQRRSRKERFRWQDRAFDLTASLRDRTMEQGFFGIDMASTGRGKTLANGRIMYALANPDQGARFTIALGLRTLTLQTGHVYRERLGLNTDELAIRVGGNGSRQLFEHQESRAAATGSASSQPLMDDDSHVYFEGNFDDHPVLRRLSHDPGIRSLIAAPILTCTVDHLVPATEATRGGRQIAPMLRLLSSDIVLDELDDFDLGDLPALTRLVNWCGMLGSRVLLSSATLPPALVVGMFEAYLAGRRVFQANRGSTYREPSIPCAWFDEGGLQSADCADSEAFRNAHLDFASKRRDRLVAEPMQRQARISPFPPAAVGTPEDELIGAFARELLDRALELHSDHHQVDPAAGNRVSVGLIRMANIEPLVAVARELFALEAPEGTSIHIRTYHSQFPSLVRSGMEHRLDDILDRHDPGRLFSHAEIREPLEHAAGEDHLFVVVGSPVTEVGRDHDYDWAVVEPSSMRSLIQLAGRVLRHRDGPPESPNIVLLSRNLRSLRRPNDAAFCNPGFEGSRQWRFQSHDLQELLRTDEYERLDATPRILSRESLSPATSLADMEHARLEDVMLPPAQPEPPKAPRRRRDPGRRLAPLNGASWYRLPRAHLTAILQRTQPFREDSAMRTALLLLPDDEEEDWRLHEVFDSHGKRRQDLYKDVEKSRLERLDLDATRGHGMHAWLEIDYMEALREISDALHLTLDVAARRFGTLSLPESDHGWKHHPWLGFFKGL